ncbi:MAG TPA: ABC transporter permease subunit [Herbaspirillum sp.]|uniref:ABC transporter permease n=1 Tax=Herbaspirillum sp. TaxID=1890675 RepID=UPI002D30039B|nr:ABC transporter permease subunit [Herbaspirillum sp.]HZG20937.1 ABC transporter permease subunit [Herbaspirillum sp.]
MKPMREMQTPLLYALLAAGLAASWQGLYWINGGSALASPGQAVLTLGSMMQTSEFWLHALETGKALLYALLIGLVGGLAAGLLLGVNRMARDVSEPILLNMYAIPKVTLYPLVLLVFGLGLSAKVAFGVMHGIIPIMVFTMNAIRQMRPVLLRAGQSMRLTRRQSLLHIVLPAILPEITAGLRLAFSLTLLGVLIGEMFASQRGLGFLLTNAMNLGDIRTIMAVALLLSVFALACNGGLMLLGRRLSPR